MSPITRLQTGYDINNGVKPVGLVVLTTDRMSTSWTLGSPLVGSASLKIPNNGETNLILIDCLLMTTYLLSNSHSHYHFYDFTKIYPSPPITIEAQGQKLEYAQHWFLFYNYKRGYLTIGSLQDLMQPHVMIFVISISLGVGYLSTLVSASRKRALRFLKCFASYHPVGLKTHFQAKSFPL